MLNRQLTLTTITRHCPVGGNRFVVKYNPEAQCAVGTQQSLRDVSHNPPTKKTSPHRGPATDINETTSGLATKYYILSTKKLFKDHHILITKQFDQRILGM